MSPAMRAARKSCTTARVASATELAAPAELGVVAVGLADMLLSSLLRLGPGRGWFAGFPVDALDPAGGRESGRLPRR
ncbi:hypothetical protein GCM10023323_77730 [Streptomyces thinghirensis]|uniref:Uncharacterized protein n=1 Tax=Streptomyces thinghirensis TaxID=551547 RepID=A0ABP9THW7_9ACTN